ncbi:MAG: hypothetical protein RL615_1447 [Pseudomonadota bacterium]
MRAVEISHYGGPEVLKAVVRPDLVLPLPGSGEVLIRVRAAGVNRPDVLQRQGCNVKASILSLLVEQIYLVWNWPVKSLAVILHTLIIFLVSKWVVGFALWWLVVLMLNIASLHWRNACQCLWVCLMLKQRVFRKRFSRFGAMSLIVGV